MEILDREPLNIGWKMAALEEVRSEVTCQASGQSHVIDFHLSRGVSPDLEQQTTLASVGADHVRALPVEER